MTNPRAIHLYASGHGKSARATLASVAKLLGTLGKARPTVAFIGVASMKDSWLVYFVISRLLMRKVACRVVRVVIAPAKADLERAREQCRAADVVFFSGGDVEVGARILREKGMVDFFRELARTDKLVFGISAGSILLGREWVRWRDASDDSTAELFPCLGVVPVLCDTHDEESDWSELRRLLELEADGTVAYGITSGSCLKVTLEGAVEVEQGVVARFVRKAGKVERLPDLPAEPGRG